MLRLSDDLDILNMVCRVFCCHLVNLFFLNDLSSRRKHTCPLAMASAFKPLCCRMNRNVECFQCQLLNLPKHMVM